MDSLVQNCSNSSVLAMELLQSCTKPLIFSLLQDCSNSSALRMNLQQSCTKSLIFSLSQVLVDVNQSSFLFAKLFFIFVFNTELSFNIDIVSPSWNEMGLIADMPNVTFTH